MVKIYDTIKKQLVNIEKKSFKMYVCGPTLYDHIHIGNARVLVYYDFLYRILRKLKYKVNYVQNITDIDDKIINNKANVAQLYQSFLNILDILNVFIPNQYFATDYIPEMQQLINTMLEKNIATKEKDGIYFHINSHKYFVLSSEQNVSRDDFCLWKFKNDQIYKANFGDGRPGWHTECVVMAKNSYIHGGGMDLIFPHHENENAQHLAVYDKNISNIWHHVNFLYINKEKMSKSLNNFIYIKDLVIDHLTGDIFRYLVLSYKSHNIINFSQEIWELAKKNIEIIRRFYFNNKKIIIPVFIEIIDSSEIIQNIHKCIKDKNVGNFYYLVDLLGFNMKKNLVNTKLWIYKLKKLKKNKEYSRLDELKKYLKTKNIDFNGQKLIYF